MANQQATKDKAKAAAPSGKASADSRQDAAGSSQEGDKDPKGTPTSERQTNELVAQNQQGRERGDVAPAQYNEVVAAQPGTPASVTTGRFVRQIEQQADGPEYPRAEDISGDDYTVENGVVTFTRDVWQEVQIPQSEQVTHVLRFNAGARFPEADAKRLGIIK